VALLERWFDKMTPRGAFQPQPFCGSVNNLDLFLLPAIDFQKTCAPLLFQKSCHGSQPWLKLVNSFQTIFKDFHS